MLDVPTVNHIPSLISSFIESSFFAKLRGHDDRDFHVRDVFHLCGDGVLEDARYKTFMNSFGPTVHVSFENI